MKVVILDNAVAVAEYGAALVREQLARKAASVLGLPTGSTPLLLYRELTGMCRGKAISFQHASSFNLDEYIGLPPDHPQSYRCYMQREFFDRIDIAPENIHLPRGDAENPLAACRDYEAAIQKAGGIDLQLLGIGRNGHIGFNEPASRLASRTRVKTLSRETLKDNARFFGEGEFQPQLAITMGIGTIMEARRIALLATGAGKAAAVKAMVEGPVSAWLPASILQMHPAAVVVMDEAAAGKLTDPGFFKHIEKQNRKLLDQLPR